MPTSQPRVNEVLVAVAVELFPALSLAIPAGSEIASDPKNLIVIEWPERVGELIADSAYRIAIEIGEGETRTIKYGN